MQAQADQAADQGAVVADVLQVAAHAQFQLVHQLFIVPALEGIGHVGAGHFAQA